MTSGDPIRDDPVLACLRGRITPEIAISRLLLAGEDAAGVRRRVEAVREESAGWSALRDLAERGPALARLRHMLDAAGVDHGEAATPAAIAALFDRAAAVSPEASVAMYSLGDPAKLQAATTELITWLRDGQFLAPDRDVLDLGCGIGRVAFAIAPHVRSVSGIDVSARMIELARRHSQSRDRAGATNVSFLVTGGQDLALFADDTFDLVLAVDSFPYLVQAGVALTHIIEARRVLRPRGTLLVLNLSYRADRTADDADAKTWAQDCGFSLLLSGTSPFRLWDARAYGFVRPD